MKIQQTEAKKTHFLAHFRRFFVDALLCPVSHSITRLKEPVSLIAVSI